MSEEQPEDVTVEVDLSADEAENIIAEAASARETLARKYLLRLLRRHPDATPAQIVRKLEKHYSRSIVAAGWIVSAGERAADAGTAMIPGGGLVVSGVRKIGERIAGRSLPSAAERVKEVLPAGTQQLQFELTALFGLALADLHGIDFDQDQAKALVMGLSNKKLKHKVMVRMTQDVAELRGGAVTHDASAWAQTLAAWIPAEHAAVLNATMKTGLLTPGGAGKPLADYGLKIKPGDDVSFAFGRAAVKAARDAFPPPPQHLPAHLELALAEAEADDDGGNRAMEAMEDAARVAGEWVAVTNAAIEDSVEAALDVIARPFRSADRDGDGVPDEPAAVAHAKELGSSLAGKLGSLGGGLAGRLRGRRGAQEEQEPAAES